MKPDLEQHLRKMLGRLWSELPQALKLTPLSGGDCSEVYRVDCIEERKNNDKTAPLQGPFCLKLGSRLGGQAGQLQAEAIGLLLMAHSISRPQDIPSGSKQNLVPRFAPRPLCWGQVGNLQLLLLEYLPPSGSSGRLHQYPGPEGLAHILYRLHSGPAAEQPPFRLCSRKLGLETTQSLRLEQYWAQLQTGERLGFVCDNFIGRTTQPNLGLDLGSFTPDSQMSREKPGAFPPACEWPEFFDCFRLRPMLEACAAKGLLGSNEHRAGERLCLRLGEILPRLERSSLLHGDLWSGNTLWCGPRPQGAALIDPACYYGHWEADLAMTQLFGGFVPEFYCEYLNLQCAGGDWEPGWPQRCEIYNLYHWLNHLLLFGRSYLGAVRSVLKQFAP